MTLHATRPPPWVNRDLPRAPRRLTPWWSLRVTRGSLLLTTGTASHDLTYPRKFYTQASCTYRCRARAALADGSE